jgi:hypothetical protein
MEVETIGTKRNVSVLSYLDRILTELRQLLELGTVTIVAVNIAKLPEILRR